MDDRAFDAFARTIANRGSRRDIVRRWAGTFALAALSWPARSAAAQGGYLGPGEACYDDNQCGNTRYSAMFCADNGFDYDGPFNCCTYEYGYCYMDEGCCGSLICVDGSCSNPALSDLPLGEQCFYEAQCLGGGNGITCADNGGFVPACCLIGGQNCTEDIDCCMPNNCVGGYCQ
jgi:hypothetical protein